MTSESAVGDGLEVTTRSVGVSRRSFIAMGATLGAATVVAPRWTGPWAAATTPAEGDFLEATIDGLAEAMASGAASSVDITRFYLARIEQIDPVLHSVIETNPDALAIAESLDRERREGRVRGPLHGVPFLVKDNIASADRLRTTAGSLALLDATVPEDARVVALLRAAGAVVLGKSNLSEWANIRGGSDEYPPINGWSARGGFTRNPYRLDADTSGSSSGSAVAVAANLCAVAIGTETDGSIISPAGANHCVGLKPTVGLVSQHGIIPISASQDTAGPMTRTVTDAAILLGVLQSPFPGPGLAPPGDLPTDYTTFLRADALGGARIGVDPQYLDRHKQGFDSSDAPLLDIDAALDTLRQAGATVVEDVDTGDFEGWLEAEVTVLLFELKVGLAQYLARLGNTELRTLADVIAFNTAHCHEELVYFGQEFFEAAEATSGDLDDPVYRKALARCRRLTRTEGIDRAFREHSLDAVVGPPVGYIATAPAVAGYPHIAVPADFDSKGRPIGLSFFARPWEEGKLLGYAYAFEQAHGARRQPRLEGTVPAEPGRYPGCEGTVGASGAVDRRPARVRRAAWSMRRLG